MLPAPAAAAGSLTTRLRTRRQEVALGVKSFSIDALLNKGDRHSSDDGRQEMLVVVVMAPVAITTALALVWTLPWRSERGEEDEQLLV